jgi:hypothetical protein
MMLSSMPDLIGRSTVLSGLFIAAALICLELSWIHFWASGPPGQGEADHQAVAASLTTTTAG